MWSVKPYLLVNLEFGLILPPKWVFWGPGRSSYQVVIKTLFLSLQPPLKSGVRRCDLRNLLVNLEFGLILPPKWVCSEQFDTMKDTVWQRSFETMMSRDLGYNRSDSFLPPSLVVNVCYTVCPLEGLHYTDSPCFNPFSSNKGLRPWTTCK